jgi:glycosyltransferase involved in cell wall biosynthesis
MKPANSDPLSVCAILDADRVTGPARQLLAAASHEPRRFTTRVVTFFRHRGFSPFTEAASSLGLAVDRLTDRFPGDPATIREFRALVRSGREAVLQTHGYKANVLAAFLAGAQRRRWIAFLHGETWENAKVRLYFALERRLVRLARYVAVVSQDMARRVAAQGVPATRIRVVPNACLGTGSDQNRVAAVSRTRAPCVGVAGRLSPEKGVDLALKAHQRLCQDLPRARLLVAGDGPERGALARLANQLGLDGSVTWLGHCHDMRAFYEAIDVLLVPSRSEGMPNVVLEAMTCGVPIVGTRVGGIPELLEHGRTGFLAPPEDHQGLAERLAFLFAHVDVRQKVAVRARERVAARFSLEARVASLAALYEEALA